MTAIDPGPWNGLRLVRPIEGGHRNEVWSGEFDGSRVAVRRSMRRSASLEWELDVIEQVGAAGIGVADVMRSDDGHRSINGVVVQRWVEGREPTTVGDWRLAAATLQRIHTIDADQRPDAMPVIELQPDSRSIDADLNVLPDDVCERILGVFGSFADVHVSLIHGDPNPSNIRIDVDDRVHFLDWDESRVDLSWHDLSNLGVQVLDDRDHARAVRLSHAWEAANAWTAEPEYARSRYEQLLQLGDR